VDAKKDNVDDEDQEGLDWRENAVNEEKIFEVAERGNAVPPDHSPLLRYLDCSSIG
jgi:hypothetical protein